MGLKGMPDERQNEPPVEELMDLSKLGSSTLFKRLSAETAIIGLEVQGLKLLSHLTDICHRWLGIGHGPLKLTIHHATVVICWNVRHPAGRSQIRNSTGLIACLLLLWPPILWNDVPDELLSPLINPRLYLDKRGTVLGAEGKVKFDSYPGARLTLLTGSRNPRVVRASSSIKRNSLGIDLCSGHF
jgi:hypothetical protein